MLANWIVQQQVVGVCTIVNGNDNQLSDGLVTRFGVKPGLGNGEGVGANNLPVANR